MEVWCLGNFVSTVDRDKLTMPVKLAGPRPTSFLSAGTGHALVDTAWYCCAASNLPQPVSISLRSGRVNSNVIDKELLKESQTINLFFCVQISHSHLATFGYSAEFVSHSELSAMV